MDNKEIDKIVKRIKKENECIVIISEGILFMDGDMEGCINSMAFMLYQLSNHTPDLFNRIMKEFEITNKDDPCKFKDIKKKEPKN